MNTRNKDSSVRVTLDEKTLKRIASGPLSATGGRGAATWVRGLINQALDEFDGVTSGKTQVDVDALRQARQCSTRA